MLRNYLSQGGKEYMLRNYLSSLKGLAQFIRVAEEAGKKFITVLYFKNLKVFDYIWRI